MRGQGPTNLPHGEAGGPGARGKSSGPETANYPAAGGEEEAGGPGLPTGLPGQGSGKGGKGLRGLELSPEGRLRRTPILLPFNSYLFERNKMG